MIDYSEVGKRVARRRALLNITQEELATNAGLSLSQIGSIERATSKCSIDTLTKICEVLDVTPDYLLLGVYKSLRQDAVAHLMNLMYRCSGKKQDHIFKYADWMAD